MITAAIKPIIEMLIDYHKKEHERIKQDDTEDNNVPFSSIR